MKKSLVEAQQELIQEAAELYETIVENFPVENQESELKLMFRFKEDDFAELFGIKFREDMIDLARQWYEKGEHRKAC